MSERRAYRISGRVQGVGFRWWVRERAAGLGIRGTVRNDADGTVRVEAGGDPEALDGFEELLRRGPHSARVDEVRAEPPGAETLPAGFEITA